MSRDPELIDLRWTGLDPAITAALEDLWVASWAAAMPGIDFAARRHWLGTHLLTLEAGGARTLAARDEGGWLGFVVFDPGRGWLDQIVVAPEAQGSGLARRLLDTVKAACPAGVRLDVNADNLRAVRFYAREGFVVTGEGTNPRSGLPTLDLHWPGVTPPRSN